MVRGDTNHGVGGLSKSHFIKGARGFFVPRFLSLNHGVVMTICLRCLALHQSPFTL